MQCSVKTQSTTAQAEAFLPLAKVKEGIRVRHSHENAKITRMRDDAISRCESYARIAILPKTIIATFRGYHRRGDEFGVSGSWVDPDRIRQGAKLPFPKILAITSLNGVSRLNAITSVDVGHYEIDPHGKRLLWLKTPPYFPTYRVEYTVGYYGATESIDLEALRTAVIETVQDAYDNPGEASDLPRTAKQSLKPFWNSPLG